MLRHKFLIATGRCLNVWLLILSWVLWSCQNAENDFAFYNDCTDLTELNISMKVASPLNGTNTRGFIEASDPESRIDADDLFVAIYGESGELVKVVYDTAGFSKESGDGELIDTNLITVGLESGETSAKYIVAACVNFSSCIESTLDISTLDTFRESIYLYPYIEDDETKMSCAPPLPMSGQTEIGAAELAESISKGKPINVELTLGRVFAKIEVRDALESDTWSLKSVSLNNFKSGGTLFPSLSTENDQYAIIDHLETLEFQKDETPGKFYAYVSENNLSGGYDDESRKIKLTFSGPEEEREAFIYLWPYKEGEPATEAGEWNSLEANHYYRFNITSFAPKEKDNDLEDEIYIIYVDYAEGRFENEYSLFINFTYDPPSDTWTPGFLLNSHIQYKTQGFKYSEDFSYNSECRYFSVTKEALYGLENFGSLRYILRPDNQNRNNEDALLSYLKEDCEKIEKRMVNGKYISFLWLNSPPIYDTQRGFTPDKIRVYWKPAGIQTNIEIGNKKQWKPEEIKELRGYGYVDYEIEPGWDNLGDGIHYEISVKCRTHNDDHAIEGYFTNKDVYKSEKDGGIYVFYAN